MNNDVKIFGGIIGATILLIIGAVFFLGRTAPAPTTNEKVKATVFPKSVLIKENSWAIGSPSAKVSIVEFGDFQCPSCKIEEPIVQQILKLYGKKVYFVYRHFPLTQVHQYALSSADAAEAAGMQGKFWEYHDKLYKISPDLEPQNLTKAAKDIGLDVEKFSKDLVSDAARQRVLEDMADGNKVQVGGTPTFFINGKLLRTPSLPTLSDFKSTIEPLLK